jgi:ABC-type multidrug transport system ATPase subunit
LYLRGGNLNILEAKHLSKKYGNLNVLKDISFSIRSGEVVGLLGLNGAGKTTLMNCITGITNLDKGIIQFNKINLLHNKSILINPVFLNYLSIIDNLRVLGFYSGLSKKELDIEIPELIKLVGLDGKENAKPEELSFGQRQKLGVVQSFLGNKEVLILDEPFIGQDYKGTEILMQELVNKAKSEGMMVLLSSHEYDFLEKICDRYIIIKDGLVIFDGKFERSIKYQIKINSINNSMDIEDGTIIHVEDNDKFIDKIKEYPRDVIEFTTEEVETLEDFFRKLVA